jgi:hypothetical protein
MCGCGRSGMLAQRPTTCAGPVPLPLALPSAVPAPAGGTVLLHVPPDISELADTLHAQLYRCCVSGMLGVV